MLSSSIDILHCNQEPYPFRTFRKFYQENSNNEHSELFEKINTGQGVFYTEKEQMLYDFEQRYFGINQNITTNSHHTNAYRALMERSRNCDDEIKVYPV